MNFKTTFKASCTSCTVAANHKSVTQFYRLLLLIIFLVGSLFQQQMFGQTITITTIGTGTFTVPCDVTSITVQAWGGGGAGGGSTSNNDSGDGGGGGGYTSNTLTVNSGQVIIYNIGSGGTGSINDGENGGNTTFLSLTANGGKGGIRNGGTISGIGGTASGGATNSTGSNGTAGGTRTGGNGGNGANGGAGGEGQSGGNGSDGASPGGGGGGGEQNGNNYSSGGDGGNGQLRITYTSTSLSYCSPSYDNGVRPITNVNFAAINNTTSANINGNNEIEFFCDTATVVQGSATNPISVKANTNGRSIYNFKVFIDWDQNGTFGNNTNEIYTLGTISNSTGTDFEVLTSNISVPAGASIGTTRMRVMSRNNEYSNGPCQNDGNQAYGQAEDYVVKVTAPAPTITTFPSSACAGSSIVINGTNLASTTAVRIGGTAATITGTTSTSVTVTIGTGTTGVISVTTAGGTANSATNIIVNAIPANPGALSSTSTPYCSPVVISSAGSAASGFTWYWQTTPGGTSTANSNPTYSMTTPGTQTIYLRSRNNTTGCWSLPGIITINRTVIAAMSTLATNPTPTAVESEVCYAGLNPTTSLTWSAASDATSYAVYFGTTTNPPLVATRAVTNYTFGTLLPNTTYYWKIIPSNTCGSTTATPIVWSFTTSNGPCYCDASVTSGLQSTNYINNVSFIGTLNDVNNLNTGFSNNPIGYQDFTILPNRSVQAQGEGVNVLIENPSRALVRAWVDWNNDGIFNTTGAEAVYTSNGTSIFSTTFGFVIPPTQVPGFYRIRLRINNSGGSTTINPCGIISNAGETEDYLFQVIASCNANITSLTNGESCGIPSEGVAPVDLSVTGTAGTTHIRWYDSFMGGTLVQTTPVSSGTTATWSPSIPNTTIYYVTAWNGSCESQVRTRITATIKPISNITYFPLNPESCGEDTIVTLSASGDNELITLIDENFQQDGLFGLGVFTSETLGTNNALANWQRRQSTFIPSQQVWFPAISSGLGTNKFAMATSDLGGSGYDNALLSPIVNTENFINLTLTFRMYYSDYLSTPGVDDVSIEMSTNSGSNWTSVENYNRSLGIGTRFRDVSFTVPSTYLNQTNLRFRFRYKSGYANGVAIDDIKMFGERPLAPSFDWGATPVNAYQDFACTIPYESGTTIGTVYVKPTLAQLELGTFNFTATATLNNGCNSIQPITITNKSRVWKGTVNQNWNEPNNWLPRGVPTIDNCVIIPETAKIPKTGVSTGYEAYAKNLTIKNTGNLEVTSTNNLTVKEWIRNNGTNNFFIRNNASLIQIDNSMNVGPIQMDRTAMVKKTDYVYYSSPVDGFSMTNLSPGTPNAVKFSWLPTTNAGDGFVYGDWATAGSDMMNLGKGYIVRGPSSFATAQSLTATFKGTPRNGDITVPISRGHFTGANTTHQGRMVTKDDDNYNLIGNPYPSAISANAFLSHAQNTNILGSIYLWPHGGLLSSANPDPFYQDFAYNYNSDDYVTYNGMGSVPEGAFDGFVAAGQGFFVLMTDDASTAENVFFNNAMRLSNNNSQFLRSTTADLESTVEPETLELHRIYLDMVLPNGKINSTLVGYTPTASIGFDRLFDTPILDNTTQGIYSKIGEDAMIIQGRQAPVDPSDRIPLGVLITQQGIHTIAINSIDGVFADQEQTIYLEDVETGILHNLKNAPYTFSTSTGRYDNRFILRYNDDSTLGTSEFKDTSDLSIIKLNSSIKVTSEKSPIETIAVYDVSGRMLFDHRKLNANAFSIPMDTYSQGTFIVKVTLQNGQQKTKKIVH